MRRVFLSMSTMIFATLNITACGESDQVDDQDANATPAQTAQQVATDIAAAFVPQADQFGVERFKIVFDIEGQETGTRTMWVEEYGTRVGVEDNLTVYNQTQHRLYFWDGSRGHMKDLPDGPSSSSPLRTKSSEPTSFATTPASDLATVGYERIGDKDIVGKTCEHWRNDQFNFEGCRWNRIELEFLNGAGTDRIIQRSVATELVEGEGIPDRIKALAQGG